MKNKNLIAMRTEKFLIVIVKKIWFMIQWRYFYIRYQMIEDFRACIWKWIWEPQKKNSFFISGDCFDFGLDFQELKVESHLTLGDIFPEFKNWSKKEMTDFGKDYLDLKLLPAPSEILSDRKQSRQYLCKACKKIYSIPKEAIFCCAALGLHPYKVGDIIILENKTLAQPIDKDFIHWAFKIDKKSEYRTDVLPYFVITEITNVPDIIENGRSSVKYHVETKAISSVFGRGWMTPDMMTKNGIRVIECPATKVVKESLELIGHSFQIQL